jgi:CRP-like cAMP-binding protein
MKRVSGGAVTKQKKRNVITNRTDEDYDDFHKVVVNKSEEHKGSILKALQAHFLFQDLAPSSLRDLVDVMKPRVHKASEDIIKQGAMGEEFFVLVSGTAEVLIEGVGKVHQYENVGAFGELALMYSAPRAATIRTVTKCELYTLDLRTFRFVLAQANESGLMARVNFLRKVKLLQGLGDNQITRIAGALTEETFTDGTYIIKQGDMGDAFYIINHGNVKCTATKDNGTETDLITLKDGDYFGEMALMLDEPRHANCIAVNGDAVCFKLSKSDFLSMFGPLQALLEKQMRLRILKSVPLLAMLSDDELGKVAKAMRVQMFNPGSAIIKEGESGSRFYIINDGVVAVTQNRKGVEVELAQLKENDYFGERALIKNEPRKASVTAVTAVELLVLEQKWFQQLLLPSAQGSIEDEMKRREDIKAHSVNAGSVATPSSGAAADGSAAAPAAASEAASLRPQKPKPKFEDLKFYGVIGTGTFGRVKLVQDKNTLRVMALKCMAKHQIVSSHQEKNILNEKNILDECMHPFILEQVATYQSPDELFILMEIIQVHTSQLLSSSFSIFVSLFNATPFLSIFFACVDAFFSHAYVI